MLDVERDFDTTVAVPAVSNLDELRVVLHESRALDPGSVDQTINMIRDRTGTESVAVGVKAILSCIFKARNQGPGSSMVENLSDLLAEKINQIRM